MEDTEPERDSKKSNKDKKKEPLLNKKKSKKDK